MTIPTISVIMPAYNHEKYIAQAIDSVLCQTYSDIELIIINDGSTDTSEQIIQKYTDNRIRYYYQDNQDAYNAINNGLSLAKGKFISIINSDDVYDADRLRQLLAAIKNNDATFIFTSVQFIDDYGTIIDDTKHPANIWYNNLNNIYRSTKSLEQTFLTDNIAVTTSNFFFTKELLNNVGQFMPFRYTHDYDFVLRALFNDKQRLCYFNGKPLLNYRIHSKNTISESRLRVYRERFRILLDRLSESNNQKNNLLIIQYLEELYSDAILNYEDCEQIKNKFYASLSWKITSPLRKLADIIK